MWRYMIDSIGKVLIPRKSIAFLRNYKVYSRT